MQEREEEETARAFANNDAVLMNAPQLILNPIYDSIGFDRIPDEVLRHLVIARICQPQSKMATVDYLRSHFEEDYTLDKIYYYMDKLYDAAWDGWKGYITNTAIAAEEVVTQYHGLWVVERAFRITKGNLEVRPVFHFTPTRIEAHICICFIAYKVYKELERIMIPT